MKKQILLLCILMLLTACSSPPPTLPKADQLATIVSETLTAHPILVFTPIPTLTAANTPTVATTEPYVPYFTSTTAQNVNLRVQPGTLFPVSRVMPQGSKLEVLGVSLGGGWLYVFFTAQNVSGWVDSTFVEDVPDGPFNVMYPMHSQIVSGRVVDSNGNPVSGIGFAIEQGKLRTEATTDIGGNFFVYLPESASGVWRVSYISIAATSNLMNSACLNDGICGETKPISIDVTLPTTAPVTFIWE